MAPQKKKLKEVAADTEVRCYFYFNKINGFPREKFVRVIQSKDLQAEYVFEQPSGGPDAPLIKFIAELCVFEKGEAVAFVFLQETT